MTTSHDFAPPYMTAEVVKAIAAMTVVPTNRHGANVEWHINGSSVEVEFDATGTVIGVSWERA